MLHDHAATMVSSAAERTSCPNSVSAEPQGSSMSQHVTACLQCARVCPRAQGQCRRLWQHVGVQQDSIRER